MRSYPGIELHERTGLRSERAFDGWLGWPADDEHLFTFEVAEGCTRWETARILTRKSWKAVWSTWDYKTPITWAVSTAAINIDRVIIDIGVLTANISRRAISDRRWHRQEEFLPVRDQFSLNHYHYLHRRSQCSFSRHLSFLFFFLRCAIFFLHGQKKARNWRAPFILQINQRNFNVITTSFQNQSIFASIVLKQKANCRIAH